MRIAVWPLALVLCCMGAAAGEAKPGWTTVRLRLDHASAGVAAAAPAPGAPATGARLSASQLLPPAPDGHAPPARVALLGLESARGTPARQRDPVPLEHQLVVRMLDADGHELYRTHVADPRHLRAETLDAGGRLVTSDRYRNQAELRVQLPSDPRAAILEVGVPAAPRSPRVDPYGRVPLEDAR